MLSMPPYIEMSGVAGAPIRHKWNDDDPDTFYTESDRIQMVIAKTTTNGAAALAAGSVEWVAWRMSKHADVTVLLQAIEATWAAIVDSRYVRSLYDSPLALKQKEWRGAERGPVYAAYWQLRDVLRPLAKNEPASPEASTSVRLARYVMPSAKLKIFETWWRFAAKRLAELHPDSEEGKNDTGKPIPREALNPDIDYKPSDASGYLTAFLRGLDPRSNPFLSSAAEMKKAGFAGSPYKA
jgi:hypothetical protein